MTSRLQSFGAAAILGAAAALSACRSTPEYTCEACLAVAVLPPTDTPVAQLAARLLDHPFPPDGQEHATACISPITTNASPELIEALQHHLEQSGKLTFITPPTPTHNHPTKLPSDTIAGQIAHIRDCGARYLIELDVTSNGAPTILAEITDTATSLVIIRKVSP